MFALVVAACGVLEAVKRDGDDGVDAGEEAVVGELERECLCHIARQVGDVVIFCVVEDVVVGAVFRVVEYARCAFHRHFAGEKLLHGVELHTVQAGERHIGETFHADMLLAVAKHPAAHGAVARHEQVGYRCGYLTPFHRRI